MNIQLLSRDFTTRDVLELLYKRGKILVHFSGSPRGQGTARTDNLFPNDLNHVIADKAQNGVSCSTVGPADCFFGSNRNATGCIGVIIVPVTPQSIRSAEPCDMGSYEGEDGVRLPVYQEVTLSHLDDTIINRRVGAYNEWVVAEYRVVGIFAALPLEVWQMLPILNQGHVPINLRIRESVGQVTRVSLSSVESAFSSFPIFGAQGGRFCALRNGSANDASWMDIYGSGF